MTILRKRLFEWRANLSLRLTPFRVSLLLKQYLYIQAKSTAKHRLLLLCAK